MSSRIIAIPRKSRFTRTGETLPARRFQVISREETRVVTAIAVVGGPVATSGARVHELPAARERNEDKHAAWPRKCQRGSLMRLRP